MHALILYITYILWNYCDFQGKTVNSLLAMTKWKYTQWKSVHTPYSALRQSPRRKYSCYRKMRVI